MSGAHVPSEAQRRDPLKERARLRLFEDLIAKVAAQRARIESLGLRPMAVMVNALVLADCDAENLTMLYGLPIVTTPLYGRQVVVTGGFVES